MADSYPKPFSNKIELDKNKVLGRGNSVVYSGSYERHPVAVKRIVVDTLSKEDREVKTQVRLDHDNVLKILTVEQDADFRYIVLELCTGTLADVCNNKYQGPDLPSDCTVLIEIATGLQYIHSKKLIHRDIKPENILISLDGRIKLSDFGLCKETSTNHTYLVSGPLKGTGIWMAQEMLNISVTDSTPIKGSIQSDIFSAGCVFFYFVTRGIHPFGEDNLIAGNIIKDTPVNFDKLNKGSFSFDVIRQMLRHQPNERIDLEQVLDQLKYQLTLQPGYNRLANVVRRMSQKSAISYGIDIYNLPFKEVRNRDTQRVDRFYFGKTPLASNSSMQKTILIVGDRGSGKSNLINAMANYVLGVEWKDDFRFKLIDEDHNQMDQVIFYHLNKKEGSRIGCPLTIVDAPTFTGHQDNDEKIYLRIKDCFRSSNEIEKINAICIVIYSFHSTLTQEQRNWISHIRNIFRDIEDEIRLLVTYDENCLPDMRTVIEADEIFGPLDLPHYYFFNNLNFFPTNTPDHNTYKRTFFDISVKNFAKFFFHLETLLFNLNPAI